MTTQATFHRFVYYLIVVMSPSLKLRVEYIRPDVPLAIHWDRKILEDIAGRETAERLPILVPGEGVE